jgi:hypothetical protein
MTTLRKSIDIPFFSTTVWLPSTSLRNSGAGEARDDE